MKKILVSLKLMGSSLFTLAQGGGWKIKLNGITIISTAIENEKKNIRRIKLADWNKKGFLEIQYKESERNKWKRNFLLFDEEDNEIWSAENNTIAKISLPTLRKLFAGKKEIRIYTIASPIDPNIAVRVRRLHLCTLRLP